MQDLNENNKILKNNIRLTSVTMDDIKAVSGSRLRGSKKSEVRALLRFCVNYVNCNRRRS